MNEEKRETIVVVFIVVVVLSIICSIFYIGFYFDKKKLENVCYDKGYNELTDYNLFGNMYYSFGECDNGEFIFSYRIDRTRECVEENKWGCIETDVIKTTIIEEIE